MTIPEIINQIIANRADELPNLNTGNLLRRVLNELVEALLLQIGTTINGINNTISALENSIPTHSNIDVLNQITQANLDKLAGLVIGFKGGFDNLTQLETQIGAGQKGWIAVLESTKTVWMWDTSTNSWVDATAITPEQLETLVEPIVTDLVNTALLTKLNKPTVNGSNGDFVRLLDAITGTTEFFTMAYAANLTTNSNAVGLAASQGVAIKTITDGLQSSKQNALPTNGTSGQFLAHDFTFKTISTTPWTEIALTNINVSPVSIAEITTTVDLRSQVKAGYGIEFIQNGVTRYALINTITSNTITIADGVPFVVGTDITSLRFCDTRNFAVYSLPLANESFTSLTISDILKLEANGTPILLEQSALVYAEVSCFAEDTGTNSFVQIKNNTSNVINLNSGKGLEILSANYSGPTKAALNIVQAQQIFTRNTTLRLDTDNAGNKNTRSAFMTLKFILL